ncbi:carboxylesterase family [Lecanosticta acicola]|uniref:Carboxylic ester hydrolase n=1 Tax=Lecanosticta acicola TaxID=111012 RepID=A0AAI8YX47_9PEZI|nr:carboxylesterase family [Lecanosticta acicola]
MPLLAKAAALAVLLLTSNILASPSPVEARDALPTVDLGYNIQRATLYNETGQYYNFSNIRYAQSPTGDLRFRAPKLPLKDRSQVFTGETNRICPQADPAWLATAELFIPRYYQGETSFTPADFNTSAATSALPAQDPATTEDCLFLDVHVPKGIYDQRDKKKSPVLVQIYGGGYTAGDKRSVGNPAGLLQRSQNNNNTGLIYVSLNYRLGAFGWLAGPTFQSDGTANAGLYDQRMALEWVRDNIAKFGGDPGRITVFGESAGGGSVMHQITAFGGAPAPFQQAIPQSPGFAPMASTAQQEQVFNAYLALLNVTSIKQARKLPYQALQTANIKQVGLQSAYGLFTYGPVVDGIFAPSLPGQLLGRGQFAKNVKLMVGHNANEGLLFTSPFVQNSTDFENQILSVVPSIAAFPATVQYIANTLYPPVFDGSQAEAYTNPIARTAAAVAEATFVCNAFYLDKAFHNQTYSYLFAVPPAVHGEDVAYTFFNGPNSAVTAPSVALALQEYITHFAEFGYPSEKGVPFFPLYGGNASVQVLNVSSIRQARDDAANERCNWWQKALYY